MPRQAGSSRSCRTLCAHVVQSKVACRLVHSRARERSVPAAVSLTARVHRLCGKVARVRRLVQARGLRLVALVALNRSVVHRGRPASYEHARREALAAFLSVAGPFVWPRVAALRFMLGGSRVGLGLLPSAVVPSGFGLRITPPSSGHATAGFAHCVMPLMSNVSRHVHRHST